VTPSSWPITGTSSDSLTLRRRSGSPMMFGNTPATMCVATLHRFENATAASRGHPERAESVALPVGISYRSRRDPVRPTFP
jgi:hypothetical protein